MLNHLFKLFRLFIGSTRYVDIYCVVLDCRSLPPYIKERFTDEEPHGYLNYGTSGHHFTHEAQLHEVIGQTSNTARDHLRLSNVRRKGYYGKRRLRSAWKVTH